MAMRMTDLPFSLPPVDSAKLMVSATAASGLGVLSFFIGAGALEALAVAAVAFAIGALAVLAEPAWQSARMAQEQEADMAFRLKQVVVCLDSGISFESSLRAAAGGGAFG